MPKTVAGKWGLNIALALDKLCNAVAGGSSNETVSARIGRISWENGGTIPRHRILARFLYRELDKLDSGHCDRAFQHDLHEMPEIIDESVLDKPKTKGKV
jgi:hypothetical protein